MTYESEVVKICQICDSKKLISKMFLGYLPPVNLMRDVDEHRHEEKYFPLEIIRCDNCGLVQLGHVVDQEVLFPETYPYLSGTTNILRENFKQQFEKVHSLVRLTEEDLVIDIGSNDGTLLANYSEFGCKVIGVEPSQAADVANNNGINTMKCYFNASTSAAILDEYEPAKVVTACNVFAHMPDVNGILNNIHNLLAPSGIFVSESHYLGSLIDTVQYDTIYHEHLRYYSLSILVELFSKHNLEVFHVEKIPTHGGSIRVYAAKPGVFECEPSVGVVLEEEKTIGVQDGTALDQFKTTVYETKLHLLALMSDLKIKGAKIFGIGAPSRASTLISFVGLDSSMVDVICEVKGSHKIGKYMPGTDIPVLDEAILYEEQPEFALLFSWHIADELIGILRRKGFKGKFIIPLPSPIIV